jgi:hypothetical protein
MAQAEEFTAPGWQLVPGTGCTNNLFKNLFADKCGGPAFRVNDLNCTNNIVIGAQFMDALHGGFSVVQTNLLTVLSHPLSAGN